MKKQTDTQEKDQMEQEASVEEIFGQLDGILERLNDGTLSLEDSFKWYEAGVKLVKTCNEKIDRVEKKIIVLNEGNA